MKILILSFLLLLVGCARTSCELAIDNLQPAAKIPKTASIEIADRIIADEGGNIILKNYVILSKQVGDVIDACQAKK